jgi:prepilin-type N-terminal cleavage/methylation domain-containing protein
MRQRSASNHGFTIVELLTVMTIIAILAGLLFPSFQRIREAMRRTTCMSNLRQIGQGCIRYSVDYGDFFPTVYRPSTDPSPVPSSPLKSLSLLYDNYIPQRKIFVCPSTADICLDLQAGDSFSPHGLAGRAQAANLKQTSYGYDDTKATPLTNPEVAIAADAPPAPEENVGGVSSTNASSDQAMAKNSANHRRGAADQGGQNVLYYNGNVKWWVYPSAGLDGDIIYDAAIQTNPADTDSYIHQ